MKKTKIKIIIWINICVNDSMIIKWNILRKGHDGERYQYKNEEKNPHELRWRTSNWNEKRNESILLWLKRLYVRYICFYIDFFVYELILDIFLLISYLFQRVRLNFWYESIWQKLFKFVCVSIMRGCTLQESS